MGAGKYENNRGVGTLLNKKWRKRIKDTEYISERAITTSTTVKHQRVMLMSVNFRHSGYADHHIQKMYRTIEKHTKSSKKSIQIVGGDFNAELGPHYGVECVSVGPHPLKGEQKKRLDEAMADDTEKKRRKSKLLTDRQKVLQVCAGNSSTRC